jgi:hypothetical protein
VSDPANCNDTSISRGGSASRVVRPISRSSNAANAWNISEPTNVPNTRRARVAG